MTRSTSFTGTSPANDRDVQDEPKVKLPNGKKVKLEDFNKEMQKFLDKRDSETREQERVRVNERIAVMDEQYAKAIANIQTKYGVTDKPDFLSNPDEAWYEAHLSGVITYQALQRFMRLFRNRAQLEGVVGDREAIGPDLAQRVLTELNKGETNDPQEALQRVREAQRKADLSKADLSKADLSEAILSGADLTRVHLDGANLTGTDLCYATGIGSEEIERQAYSLEGATMPNGHKYEDWLKSKDRGEDE